jgi:Ca2+-binding EF-hand superfamily protein
MSIFTGLDQNSDGVLSPTEAQAMVTERFKRLDANGDGMITQEEIQAKRRFGLR